MSGLPNATSDRTTIDSTMGKCISIHPTEFTWQGFLICAVGLLALFSYAMIRSPDARESPKAFGMAVGSMWCIGVAVLLAYAWWHRGKSVELCERGLICRKRSAAVYVAWEDILSIRVTHLSSTQARSVYLETAAGRSVKLGTWLEEFNKLAQAVLSNSHSHRVDRAKRVLQQGRAVRFGLLAVSRHGLTAKARELRWQDIGAIEVFTPKILNKETLPKLRVRKVASPGNWFWCLLRKVPDFDVVLAIAADYIPRKTDDVARDE